MTHTNPSSTTRIPQKRIPKYLQVVSVVVGDERAEEAVPMVSLEAVADFGVAEDLQNVGGRHAEEEIDGRAVFLAYDRGRGGTGGG